MEALLFVAEEPVDVSVLARSLGVTRARMERALEELAGRLAGRGVRLQRTGELVQLVSAPEWARYVERFLGAEYPRLSDAAL
ncbi:MAG TPA: SMC-Scp complex subunit ScpB, partial [Dehalococcoidia bacterium]|nr:SMC-Scp complex subunit ScpB [Dehalococcoidia bacterium]